MSDRKTVIHGSQIKDGTIEPPDLNIINSAIGGYILSYDSASGEFKWISLNNLIDNVLLNAFRISVIGSYTKQQMEDGFIDEFQDETGIGTKTNATYDGTNHLYKPTVEAATLLDYFEYATDGAAQAAYVTNSGEISNGDIDSEDMSDITSWTNLDGGGGISSQVTFDSKSCMKLDSGASLNGYAVRYKDVGTFGTRTIFSWNLYCEAIGTLPNGDYVTIFLDNGTTYMGIWFTSSGLFVRGSGWTNVGNIIQQGVWQEWTFDVNWTAKTMDVYLNRILQASGVDANYTTGATNGYVRLNIEGDTNTHRIAYIDWFKAGSDVVIPLQSYSEVTIKIQGSYSLKGIAAITDSLNKTLTRIVSPTINLSGKNSISFDIRSSRTGSNIKIGIHDSGGITTEITPNITNANQWQTITWNISGVSDANKDAIDSIIITIVNADADNTFYIDNMFSGLSLVNNMTLISTIYTANLLSTFARLVLFEEDVDSITLNTDLLAYFSRDGGTTYTQITLVNDGNYATGKRILAGSADISGQPSGTSIIWKILTANNKNLNLYGAGASWR